MSDLIRLADLRKRLGLSRSAVYRRLRRAGVVPEGHSVRVSDLVRAGLLAAEAPKVPICSDCDAQAVYTCPCCRSVLR